MKQRSKKTFQSLIMEVQVKEGLPKSKFNPRIVSYLPFEDYFSKLEENKISPTLNT